MYVHLLTYPYMSHVGECYCLPVCKCAESQHVCFWHKTFNEIDAFVPTKRENDIIGNRAKKIYTEQNDEQVSSRV